MSCNFLNGLMQSITLVSSFHKNLGSCNPNELYKIIQGIQPEIIFEELSVDTFSSVYAKGYIPKTIEALAIKNYIRKHAIMHFPVDTYPIRESDLFNGADLIAKKSVEYVKLWKEKVSMIIERGFTFLNSNACAELMEKISDIEERVLIEMNNEKLSREYISENELNSKREYEMLKNIYDYSCNYQYSKAMFICGVKHREPLKKKIKEYEKKQNLNINWKFYNNYDDMCR